MKVDGVLYTVNTEDGSLKWSFSSPGVTRIDGDPVISPDGSKVYVGEGVFDRNQGTFGRGLFVALDLATGTELWSHNMGGENTAAPIISADGTAVYVGSRDKAFYAFNEKP